jgi:hypothetical protein
LLGPAPEHDEQDVSHDWHEPDDVSKNWFLEHVGRQRPLESTGRSAGHEAHWLKAVPEHVAQSGWHATHAPDDGKVFDGQLVTHLPFDASWLFAQVVQKVEEPKHVPQVESHARCVD